MSRTHARRLDALERGAPEGETAYLWRDPHQTEAEVIAARFGTPTPPAGVNLVFFTWVEAPEAGEAVH